MTRSILVSGFGEFSGISRNPSGEAAQSLAGTRFGNTQVAGVVLPVSWSQSWSKLESAIHEVAPSGVILLGVAPTPFVRLEVLAMNAAYPEEDIHGQVAPRAPLLRLRSDAPAAYHSLFDLDGLRTRLLSDETNWGMPMSKGRVGVELWAGAGSYLCNYIFFQTLHAYRYKFPVVFAHVPSLEYCALEGALFTADQLRASVNSLVANCAGMIEEALAWSVNPEWLAAREAMSRAAQSARRLLVHARTSIGRNA